MFINTCRHSLYNCSQTGHITYSDCYQASSEMNRKFIWQTTNLPSFETIFCLLSRRQVEDLLHTTKTNKMYPLLYNHINYGKENNSVDGYRFNRWQAWNLRDFRVFGRNNEVMCSENKTRCRNSWINLVIS